MRLYEKFVSRPRDDFATLEDLNRNYKISSGPNFNFAYDCLDVIAAETPDARALLWVGNDQTERDFTFADIAKLSNKCANWLTATGIKRGDRVLLIMSRDYRYWYTLMALHRVGAVVVPASYLLTKKDMEYRLNAAEISMVIVTPRFGVADVVDEAAPASPTLKYKAIFGETRQGWLDFDAGVAAAPDVFKRPEPFNNAGDMAMLAFSSGTTGHPKMVHHDFTYPLGHILTGCFWHRCEEGGLHFTISDTGWLKSLWGKMYGQWLAGCAIFAYDFDKFSAVDILKKVEKYRVTSFCAPPTMYRFMIQEDLKSYDFSALKHCATAGEALNPEVYNVWLKGTGLKLFEGFGQTETTICCMTAYPWMQPRLGSMGVPAPGYRMFIADADGNEVADGVNGEICIRTDEAGGGKPYGLFSGYYKDDELTREVWHDDLYHTGDTAYRDELGFFWYVGRLDDVIKSSGYRIGPFEVESALMEHAAVVECAVTGVPDPVRGFAVKATVVLAAGFEGSPELTKELQNHVKKVTAPYKYPRIIEYVASLPKTISGKIRRVEIREKDQAASNN
ncbi:acetyl-CoA synthetase [Clostridia bacterium]|nr:acetyl-CoA synthetase [Clostridia bacterium]